MMTNSECFSVKSFKKTINQNVIGLGIIINDLEEILIAQRLDGNIMEGLWEFPGGKQEKNESIKFTICRELKEELSVDVSIGERLIAIDHVYGQEKFYFIVHICRIIEGNPMPNASKQIRWIKPYELDQYSFPEANVPIIVALNEYFSLK